MTKKMPGTLIREARNSLQLTQRDLAAMVGVKASHIAYIENGQRNPSLALLRRLADTLGLNRRELLFLIHPDAKHLTEDHTRESKNSKPDGWRQFSTNRALLRRYNVTGAGRWHQDAHAGRDDGDRALRVCFALHRHQRSGSGGDGQVRAHVRRHGIRGCQPLLGRRISDHRR